MTLPHQIVRRLRYLFRHQKVEAEMTEEMRYHLDQRTADNLADGLPLNDAHYAAQRQFGNLTNIREQAREVHGWIWLDDFFKDSRFAFRQLAKSPGFTATALLSLALGIGACTAIFSLFNAIILRSLPVPNPQELRVLLWSSTDNSIPSIGGNSDLIGNRRTFDAVHHPLFLSLREQAAPLADVFGFCSVKEVVARAEHDPFVADGMMVSDNFFPSLGVQPVLGRLFRAGDDKPSAGANIVITHQWWEIHFALSPNVLGQSITLNGNIFTVIGVLPREFPGVSPEAPPAFYVPMQAGSPFLFDDINTTRHWFVRMMARLKPGASDTQLQSALGLVFSREAGQMVKEPAILVEAGHGGPSFDRAFYRQPLLLMSSVVGLVMLIACANLAGLSLARGTARQHEFAIRSALGSGRWRLFRQSLTESLMLALLGGTLGFLLALWGRTAIAHLLARSADGLRYDLSLDPQVFGFGLAAALVTALFSGWLPAWRASRVDPLDGLKARGMLGASRLRLGKILVIAQIGLSLLLLTGAGLYLRSLANLRNIDAGFSTEKMLVFDLNPAAIGYKGTALTAFYAKTQEALAAIPGVSGATLVQFPLLSNRAWWIGFSLPGRPAQPQSNLQGQRLTVGETFFTTMGIPIIRGRELGTGDVEGAPNALVVNDTFVRKYFPSEEPLGQTVKINGIDWQIVGVCRDSKYENIKHEVPSTVYTSFRQYTISVSTAFAVRTVLPPQALATAVRKAVADIDPNVPVAHFTTQDALRDGNIGQEQLLASLCSALATLALLLSCIGLYGLIAFNVARRRNEIAIRMAIGAQSEDIARPILREALGLAAIGITVGLPAVFAATRLIKSELYGVQSNDPGILSLVIGLLVVIALLAAWLPARRAGKIDPICALRAE